MVPTNCGFGVFNSAIAATIGRWADRPRTAWEQVLRAVGRHMRRAIRTHQVPIPRSPLWVSVESSPRRPPPLIWHHVAVRALLDAARMRRNGDASLARIYLQDAKAARQKSKWL